jgi:hypothetical protein
MAPQASRPKLGPASEAAKRAEAIFETRTVVEIRDIEARARREIESKNRELRQLLGDSYRDMIDAADRIVSISDNCGRMLADMGGLQARVGGVGTVAPPRCRMRLPCQLARQLPSLILPLARSSAAAST